MTNHHRHVLTGEETSSRDSSAPEESPDQPSPAAPEPSLPGLAGGQLEVFAEVADLRAPFVPAPNLMLIQAVAQSAGPEAEETIRRHHEHLADEANGELQCSMEAIVALALGTLRAIELDAVRLRKELAKVNQF